MENKFKIEEPESTFLEVECRKCGKKHIIFDKSATRVECECGEEIAEPTGGFARIKGKITKELE